MGSTYGTGFGVLEASRSHGELLVQAVVIFFGELQRRSVKDLWLLRRLLGGAFRESQRLNSIPPTWVAV